MTIWPHHSSPAPEKPDANAYNNSACYDARGIVLSGATVSSNFSRQPPEFVLLDHTYAKSSLTYKVLLTRAITSHHEKKATLQQIYRWLKDNHGEDPKPKLTKPKWQNSVRHALSSYPIFMSINEMEGKTKKHWTIVSSSESVPPRIKRKPDGQANMKTGHSTSH